MNNDETLMHVDTRYRLSHRLGQGGMASVWAADDLTSGGQVAIKFLAPELAKFEAQKERFRDEAITLQQFAGPNIVRVFEHGEDQHGRPYIVMELLAGEDLQERLEREVILTPEETSLLVNQIANGLQRVHEAGIVHRDLKPSNVFFARVDDEDEVKLVDFGIAKIQRAGSNAQVTKTGTVVGTFNYMSPEQIKDSKNVDLRSDVWSLGVIAFRALTGSLPFPGDELPELVSKICNEPIPVPSEVAPERSLSPHVDAFFRTALQRDRQLRFQTAAEFAVSFDRVIKGLPPKEPPKTALLVPPEAETPAQEEIKPPAKPPADISTPRTEQISASGAARPQVSGADSSTSGVSVKPDEPILRGASPVNKTALIAVPLLVVALVASLIWGSMRRSEPQANANGTTSATNATSTAASVPARVDSPAEANSAAQGGAVSASPSNGAATSLNGAPQPAASSSAGAKRSSTPPVPAQPSSRPRARKKDLYCQNVNPQKPYSSLTEGPGCEQIGAYYCCP